MPLLSHQQLKSLILAGGGSLPLVLSSLVSNCIHYSPRFTFSGYCTAASFASVPISSSSSTRLLFSRESNKNNGEEWFLSEEAPPTLPFDCTGCGKCCKVQGTVVMSPKEVLLAAKFLNVSVSDFKLLYVEQEQETKTIDQQPEEGTPATTTSIVQGWVKLRDKPKLELSTATKNKHVEVVDPSISACIFLDENNQCKIYEARPMQCLSYPFWPNIMASRQTWNEEVNLPGDAPAEEDTRVIDGKYWTPQEGGCEGMSKILDTTSTAAAEGQKILSSQKFSGNGVPAKEAYVTLELYKRYRKSFPWEANFKPVKR